MKKLLTILIIFSAFGASAQTLTTAQLTARIIAADTAIARANRNITTLFAQNDSYKKQLTEAQTAITKLVADTTAQSKRIAALEARQIVVGSGLRMNGDTLIAVYTLPVGYVTATEFGAYKDAQTLELKSSSTRIAALEDWRKQVAAWVKIYNQ
jgi:hypothetical protein